MPVWSLHPADRRRKTGRGLRAALASLLFPGAGQLLLGDRRRATALLVATVLVLAGGVWLLRRPPGDLLAWFADPRVLLAALALNVVLLAGRLYAVFQAYGRGVRPPAEPVQPRGRLAAAGIGLVLSLVAVVVAAPHVAAGYYVAAAHGVVTTTFIEDARAGERPEGDPADRGPDDGAGQAPGPRSDPTVTIEVPGSDVPAADPADPGEAVETRDNPWVRGGRITVALLGSDAGPGRTGERIDAILVASFDPETGDVAVFSIDRYLADFPLPSRLDELYRTHCPQGDGWEFILALYRCADERAPEEFAAIYPVAEDPAAAAMTDVLSELLGLGVPYYAMVDMGGFVDVVDALGGVEVDLGQPVRVRMSPSTAGEDWYTVDLAPGVQQLDGREALAFARVRAETGGDAERMRRQRCLVTSVADRSDVGALLLGFPTLASAIEDNVRTNIPLRMVPELLELAPQIEQERAVTVGFGPPEYRGPDHRPDVERIRDRVAEVLADPGTAATAETAETGVEVCR